MQIEKNKRGYIIHQESPKSKHGYYYAGGGQWVTDYTHAKAYKTKEAAEKALTNGAIK